MTNYPAIDKETVNRLAQIMGDEHLALLMDDGCWMIVPMLEHPIDDGAMWRNTGYLGRSPRLDECLAQAQLVADTPPSSQSGSAVR